MNANDFFRSLFTTWRHFLNLKTKNMIDWFEWTFSSLLLWFEYVEMHRWFLSFDEFEEFERISQENVEQTKMLANDRTFFIPIKTYHLSFRTVFFFFYLHEIHRPNGFMTMTKILVEFSENIIAILGILFDNFRLSMTKSSINQSFVFLILQHWNTHTFSN